MGRLMLAKRPPLAWSQVQTVGGTYGVACVVSFMVVAGMWIAFPAFLQ
jgi:hypothetical protein